ncbi:MAG: acyl-CoA carboxylase subunit beta [Bacteroidetes bacterium]|nr:acyl-CoA carboxylase subunit beta [Flavobacteriaceae bacterium]MDA0608291.1 acyl-CoA carboxylase subunit beta [Bacteroidota bacterium]
MTKSKKQLTREIHHRNEVKALNEKRDRIALGGGASKLKKQHDQGKMTARERLDFLFDHPTEVIEIGQLAADNMYLDHGGCPSAGVIVQIGKINGRLCIAVANDASVKAGAWFPMTAKKNLRAQEIAIENRIPIIYLVDSAGVYLPLQDESFADKEHFGRIFRNNAKMSSMGITQIAAIMGSCVAGGAYLPIMSDEAIIVEKTGSIFLAGPYLVKAAVGEDVDKETLGGAHTHSSISGVVDYAVPSDQAALEKIQSLIGKLSETASAGFNRAVSQAPKRALEEVYTLLPESRSEPYDMTELIESLVDADSFEPYKENYGKTLITGYARIDGWAVGLVANERKVTKNAKGEMQIGGVIYSDSADKATRFIANCNQKRIPLVFLQDVTGFMVGSKSEHQGIIKDGAKLVNAVSNSVVPKFTIIVGNSYGAGNYAMCGKAYDPRLIFSWPSAEIAVMSGQSASRVLLQIEEGKYAQSKKTLTDEDKAALLQNIEAKYTETTSPYYAAARLWTDGIIDPVETRRHLSLGIEMANNNPHQEAFSMGLLQV